MKKFMKKQIKIVFLLAFVLTAMLWIGSTDVQAESYYDYTLEDGVLTIRGTGEISSYAFSGNDGIRCVVIEDGITGIGSNAFSHCSNLESITIPASLTVIGDHLLSDCTSLESITIPKNVKTIEYGAFSGCTSLKSITIPENVKTIGEAAFYRCADLTDIKIQGAASIGNRAFQSCGSLKTATLSNDLVSIGDEAFSYCGSLESIEIPNSVTGIGESAFESCRSLKSTTLSKNLTSVAARAFFGCYSLESITIPESVTSIGESAFYACMSLTELKFPDSVKTIGKGAFDECSRLKSLTIPKNAICDDVVTFMGMNSLETLNFLGSAETIRYNSFEDCTSLKKVKIGNVKSIGEFAFFRCTNLKSVEFTGNVQTVGEFAFFGCSNLKTVKFTGHVESVETYAFNDCAKLKSVEIPGSVTHIGDFAFGYDEEDELYKNFTISLTKGSAAETYAKTNGFVRKSAGTYCAAEKANKAVTVKVTKADKKTAEKVHAQLYQGKELTLKVKGKKTASEKLVKKLEEKIKTANKAGVIFRYEAGSVKDGYTTYTVSVENAKLYMYSVRFVAKLWEIAKEKCSYSDVSAAKLLCKTKNFCELSDAMKVYAIAQSGYFSCNESHKPEEWSLYNYGIIYDKTYSIYQRPKKDSVAMRTLYTNQSTGVCEVFASNERLLFDQLDITNYYNSNGNINHAWSVVKVKNSKGKTLWIPFDYGIGPSDSLSLPSFIREKYVGTEKARYKLYLAGIKGAPSKKNFTMDDFN